MTFATARLVLRPIRPAEDAAVYLALRSHPEVARYIYPPPPSVAVAAEKLAAVKTPAWALTRPGEDRYLGTIGLPRLDEAHRSTSIFWLLDRSAWGSGLMFEAASRIIEHAFRELGVHRIQAEIDPRNERSIRLATRLGLVFEGVLRDHLLLGEAFVDSAIYARLAPS